MYTYVKAIAMARTLGAQWTEVDLSKEVVSSIFNSYSRVYVELSAAGVISGNIYVDLDTLEDLYSGYGGTLEELLVELGNTTLTTVESLPSTTLKYATYSDAVMSGYKIDMCKVGYNFPASYPRSEKPDLVLTRPGYTTDMALLHKYCLISVNGYFHRTDTDGKKTYVYDGGKTNLKSNLNFVGILSFMDIGSIKNVPILAENITSGSTDTPLKDRLYFTVDEDLTNKTVILVLGGYLVFLKEGEFWPITDKTFAVNLGSFPLLERYFESRHYIDMSPLGLDVSTVDPNVVNVEQFYSDVTIKRLFTLSQSFLVVINTPTLTQDKIHLKSGGAPGLIWAYQQPKHLLITGYGKTSEYISVDEKGMWSMYVGDNYYRNFVFEYSDKKTLVNVTENLSPNYRYRHGRAFMLQIGGYN